VNHAERKRQWQRELLTSLHEGSGEEGSLIGTPPIDSTYRPDPNRQYVGGGWYSAEIPGAAELIWGDLGGG
jgi:hypothetical protein